MRFSKLANYLSQLEDTSKRLEMTAILTELIEELPQEESDIGIYLALGYLKAPFESIKFNIADKLMIKILEYTYSRDDLQKQYAALGDLGNVTYEIHKTKTTANLEISDVHQELMQIAEASGTGSQEAKTEGLCTLLQQVDNLSAKYIVRIVLGTTRLGFTELTIIDALSHHIQKDKELKSQIEAKYNMHPDIGLITKNIKKDGLKGIQNIGMEPGIPILAQKPQRLSNPRKIIEKMGGTVWAEYKFDGTRVQLHLDRNKSIRSNKTTQTELFDEEKDQTFVKTFTRNLEETTHQFPDIIAAAKTQIDAESVILDGEAMGYDKKTGNFLPFQEIIKRKRKYDIAEVAKEIPLKYFVFDLLYLNGESQLDKPLKQRRKKLSQIIKKTKNNVIEVDTHFETTSPEKLLNFFEKAKHKNLEGLVIKNPETPYQAGARSYAWIKLKKAATELLDDDFDCIILGYYFGKGARSHLGIGGFLVGIYDAKKDLFKSITKIGTGLKEQEWIQLKQDADKIRVNAKPSNVAVKKGLFPDAWVQPKIMVVVKADEISKSPIHTAGFALRFPRFVGFRTDKKPTDATSLQEIKQLHKAQKQGYY